MALAAAEHTFSIPFRYLWSTNFAGDLDELKERPSGLARFVGDKKNQILRILSEDSPDNFVNQSNGHLWPLVLFGPSGTGKTSLALTLISDLAERQAGRKPTPSRTTKTPSVRALEKPIVISAVDFDRRYRAAIATDSVADFRRRLLRCCGLVIDDVQRLAEKLAAQGELLQLIDQMLLRNRPLILTMDRDPQRCDGLIPQLVSRCCGGLSLPVNAPGRDAREIIVRDLAQIHELELTSGAIQLLVDRLNVTVPKIVHFFGQLRIALRMDNNHKTISNNGEPVSLPIIDATFITRMFYRSLSDLEKLGRVILKQVASEFRLKAKDLRSNSRKQSIVLARGVAIYLNRELLGTSFGKIGSQFGNRDHSTIMHAYRKTEKLLKNFNTAKTEGFDNGIKLQVEKLEQQLTNLFASDINIV